MNLCILSTSNNVSFAAAARRLIGICALVVASLPLASLAVAQTATSSHYTQTCSIQSANGRVVVVLNVDLSNRTLAATVSRPSAPDHVYLFTDTPLRTNVTIDGVSVLRITREDPHGPIVFANGAIFRVSEASADPEVYERAAVAFLRATLAADADLFRTLAATSREFELFAGILSIGVGATGTADSTASVSASIVPGPEPQSVPDWGCYINCVYWTGDHCACWLGCGGTRDAIGSPCPKSGQPVR